MIIFSDSRDPNQVLKTP